MVDWLGLLVPIAYLGILVGSLYTFSSLYRARRLAQVAKLAPWFSSHLQRDIYLSLLHQEEPKVPDSVLKAALLRRATEDIHRIVQIRNAKGALTTLVQRGSVGDDLGKRFEAAEKEIEEELRDVVQEANAFAPNWGQTIFQSASEMAQNTIIRQRLDELQSTVPAEKEWWEKRKAGIQSDFMKELEAEKEASAEVKAVQRSSDEDGVIVPSGGPADASAKKKKGKK